MPLSEEQKASLDGKGVDWKRVHYAEPTETLDALRSAAALLVDTRKADVYEAGHFPGAVHAREKDQLLTLPKERALYLYCT